jgi:glycine oxidase
MPGCRRRDPRQGLRLDLRGAWGTCSEGRLAGDGELEDFLVREADVGRPHPDSGLAVAETRVSDARSDILIIGGGVLGMMSAREFAAAGLRVTLLERDLLGQESSWAGGGILSPLSPWRAPAAVNALCRWSQAVYPQLCEALRDSTGVDPEWTKSGLLLGGLEDRDLALAWCESSGTNQRVLAESEVFGAEPGLPADFGAGLLLPDIAQVRNPRLLRALKADLRIREVQMLERHELVDWEIRGGSVASAVTRHGRFSAGQYLVASGAWSGQLGRLAGIDLPVVPVKGQMLVFQTEPTVLKHIVLVQDRYLIPRRDGRILVGSTVESSDFDKTATDAARADLTDFALRSLPALRDYPIEKHWGGLRPGSPEGIPWIGRHPSVDNLYFNCGHFRNGLVMAPASARLLADQVLGRAPCLDPGPYRIEGRQ